eukprot:6202277-Pleurochrysis_carterae.AAC.2
MAVHGDDAATGTARRRLPAQPRRRRLTQRCSRQRMCLPLSLLLAWSHANAFRSCSHSGLLPRPSIPSILTSLGSVRPRLSSKTKSV